MRTSAVGGLITSALGFPTERHVPHEFPDHAGILGACLASGDAALITGEVFRVAVGLIGRYGR